MHPQKMFSSKLEGSFDSASEANALSSQQHDNNDVEFHGRIEFRGDAGLSQRSQMVVKLGSTDKHAVSATLDT
ncbi:unnamed protein product [Protopolystoma xenopodis]|uniref:Uncharacterized protein n=1 Tax=Protopolystoma xenopodis TaxID=117903 RepID=A0A448WWS3_9PLAT|nr:unnamed protein product [Protopolystoma xenopodis]